MSDIFDKDAKRNAAVLLLALDAILCDDFRVAEDALSFARIIEGSLDKELWADGKHHGDCTKQPETCSRCLIERHEAAAQAMWDADE